MGFLGNRDGDDFVPVEYVPVCQERGITGKGDIDEARRRRSLQDRHGQDGQNDESDESFSGRQVLDTGVCELAGRI